MKFVALRNARELGAIVLVLAQAACATGGDPSVSRSPPAEQVSAPVSTQSAMVAPVSAQTSAPMPRPVSVPMPASASVSAERMERVSASNSTATENRSELQIRLEEETRGELASDKAAPRASEAGTASTGALVGPARKVSVEAATTVSVEAAAASAEAEAKASVEAAARSEAARGEAAYRSGRLDEASEAYERVVEGQPDDAHAWLRLGNVHHQRGDWFKALSAYRRAASRRGGEGTDPALRAKALYNVALINLELARQTLGTLERMGSAARAAGRTDALSNAIESTRRRLEAIAPIHRTEESTGRRDVSPHKGSSLDAPSPRSRTRTPDRRSSGDELPRVDYIRGEPR